MCCGISWLSVLYIEGVDMKTTSKNQNSVNSNVEEILYVLTIIGVILLLLSSMSWLNVFNVVIIDCK